MSTESGQGDDRMAKINVRVPESLLDQIDSAWEQRGYASKSEAIRDAPREWVAAPATLSESPLSDPETSRDPWNTGATRSVAEAGVRLDADVLRQRHR